jgi:prepilin-type N-terminal cleavage/methylation domain-containing protein
VNERTSNEAARNPERRRGAGFTLIELMVAIAVFSTLLLIAMPSFTDFQRSMAMKATARNLATNFRLAQQKAAAANRPCYMDFDLGKNFFSIWLDQDMDGAFDGVDEVQAVGFAYTDQLGAVPGVILPKFTWFESTTFAPGIRSLPQIAFASDGSVANGGEIVVRDDWKRGYKVEVTVAGGISIYQDMGGSWVE